MNIPNSSEKRDFERLDIDHPVHYSLGEEVNPRECVLDNVSASGMLLWIQDKIPLNSRLNITIHSEDPADLPIRIMATVVRQTGAKGLDRFGYGCRIETAENAAALVLN